MKHLICTLILGLLGTHAFAQSETFMQRVFPNNQNLGKSIAAQDENGLKFVVTEILDIREALTRTRLLRKVDCNQGSDYDWGRNPETLRIKGLASDGALIRYHYFVCEPYVTADIGFLRVPDSKNWYLIVSLPNSVDLAKAYKGVYNRLTDVVLNGSYAADGTADTPTTIKLVLNAERKVIEVKKM